MSLLVNDFSFVKNQLSYLEGRLAETPINNLIDKLDYSNNSKKNIFNFVIESYLLEVLNILPEPLETKISDKIFGDLIKPIVNTSSDDWEGIMSKMILVLKQYEIHEEY